MGEIYTDFNLTSDAKKAQLFTTNKQGMNQVKLDDWVYGKVGGGGQQILMKNMNGTIYIRKTK